LISLFGIAPSQRYLKIGFCQSASGLGGLTTAAISCLSPEFGSEGLAEALEVASETKIRPFSPDEVLGVGIELSSPREVPDTGIRTSYSSQMEGLNKSYANTPRGDDSWHDPSEQGLQPPHCLTGGYGEAPIRQTSPPTSLPPVGMPPCGSRDSLTPPLLD
jgi:hypothetical protein